MEVVLRTLRDWNVGSIYQRSRLQGYLTGVLDSALRAGAITQDENRMAIEAVQGNTFDEVWWL